MVLSKFLSDKSPPQAVWDAIWDVEQGLLINYVAAK
jgi:hypothetical protein